MVKPYPLCFKAEMKERVWGGRALEQFHLDLPEGQIGEGWMIGDHPNGTTTVTNGAWAGKGLDDIRSAYGQDVFGSNGYKEGQRFPLLIKLLDCNEDLSIQVHPDDHYDKLPDGELGKTEMWYVLHARPDAKIIYGLQPGTTKDSFRNALQTGDIASCLQTFDVRAGDSFYTPAGTVHALCSGVIVAEIQQNSDTTYRLYDYNRPGLDGKPRELHLEDGVEVTSFDGNHATRMTTELSDSYTWLTLADSPYFVVEKGHCESEWVLSAIPDSFSILMVVEGSGRLAWDDGELSLQVGSCILVPANLDQYVLKGNMTVLRSYVPQQNKP